MFNSIRKVVAGVALLAAFALGGAAIAGAATSSSTTGTATTGSTTRPTFSGPAPGTAAHEGAEKAVTGAAASKAQAAAVKAEGGGIAGPVTTDRRGIGYETTVTKADGTKVEVHLDSSFNVTRGPGRGHCPGMGMQAPPTGSGTARAPAPGSYGAGTAGAPSPGSYGA